MTSKMVANFRRSLSFPNQPSTTKSKKTLHVRSTSLPCRSHPILSQLKDEINELKSWGITNNAPRTIVWLCDGLKRLKIVHECLDDLLQMPQTREALRPQTELVERLLEGFLRFVDVYGIFQSLVLSIKEEFLAMQMATRRRDDAKLALHLKSLNKMAKEMAKLSSSIEYMAKYPFFPSTSPCSVADSDAELAEAMKDVVEVTVLVSNVLFNGVSMSLSWQKPTCVGLSFAKKSKKVKVEGSFEEFEGLNLKSFCGLRKKSEEEVKMVCKKMHELEDCVVEIEGCGERAFRSLINTRVSLLNVFTQ